jgi:hypothetical protein
MWSKRFVTVLSIVCMVVVVSAVALAAGTGSFAISPSPGFLSKGNADLTFTNVDLTDDLVGGTDPIITVWWDANGTIFDVDLFWSTTGIENTQGNWSVTSPIAYPVTVSALDVRKGDVCESGDPEGVACRAAIMSRTFTCIAEGFFTPSDTGLDDRNRVVSPLPVKSEPFHFCSSANASADSRVSTSMINDNRNNSYDLAAPMAIYCPDGLPHFYGINPDGSGYFIFNVTQEEIDAVGIPEVSTIIKEKWGFQLWRLPTGEYQGVSSRDAEGKIYNVIYEICTPNGEVKSWISS